MKTDTRERRQQLQDTAHKAPSTSGVYFWKDEAGTVIYVGKAKNLKNRLSSYFSGRKDIETQMQTNLKSLNTRISVGKELVQYLKSNPALEFCINS